MAELILVYGGTGSFKTAQLKFLAKYAYKAWGKRTRLASCDGGGWKPLESSVKAGLIEATVRVGKVGAMDDMRGM